MPGLFLMGVIPLQFYMNGILWSVYYTSSNDPILIDRTGTRTVAVTDPATYSIYVSELLKVPFLTKVILHELGHVMMISYGYLEEIHRMCYPEYWVEMEEFICNLIADRAKEIFLRAYDIVGDEAIHLVPSVLEMTA